MKCLTGIVDKATRVGDGVTQFRFRSRYYTAFGRLFIAAGKYTGNDDYDKACEAPHYMFTDMSDTTPEYLNGKRLSMFRDN